MNTRRLFLIGFAAALLTALGCASSGGDPIASPAIACANGDPVSPDALTLVCGVASDSTTEQIKVVMSGPALGTTTLRGINFDVTFDPLKLQFERLTPSDPTDPAALFASNAITPLAGVLAPGRVVVTIQLLRGDPDRVVSAGQYNVFSLSFKRVAGATFVSAPLTFENSEYTRPSPLTPISFPIVNGPTLSY